MRKKVIKNLKIHMKVHYLCELKPKLHKAHLAVYTGLLTSFMMNGVVLNPAEIREQELTVEQARESEVTQFSKRELKEHQTLFAGKKEYEQYVKSLSEYYGVKAKELESLLDRTMDYLLTEDDIDGAIKRVIECEIKNGTLECTPKKDIVKKELIRLTTYQYHPNSSDKELGGTIGLIEPYLAEGSVYYDENGFVIWKGGTTSKHNGVVYGEEGKNYLVVATATEHLIGQYNYQRNDQITYYSYNDAFQLEITTKNGTKTYDALVLDSCGASMNWSVTSGGKHAPETTQEKEYCRKTNNKKIDVLTAPEGFQRLTTPADTAYQLTVIKQEPKEMGKLSSNATNYLIKKYSNQDLYTVKVKTLK